MLLLECTAPVFCTALINCRLILNACLNSFSVISSYLDKLEHKGDRSELDKITIRMAFIDVNEFIKAFDEQCEEVFSPHNWNVELIEAYRQVINAIIFFIKQLDPIYQALIS